MLSSRFFYFLIVGTIWHLAGCAGPGTTTQAPDAAHNAANALDWQGSYRGILPCADCEGIETLIVLFDDGTYRRETKYLGEDNKIFSERGEFQWNAAGDSVTLGGVSPEHYFVAENRLIRLAQNGKRIGGALADNYILSKLDTGVQEKYWKLIELNGQPVPQLEREPHLILKTGDAGVVGFAGCNRFFGQYQLDQTTLRISFTQLASTMMACTAGMEVENALLEVLRKVDNYTVKGDYLSLNRARMAPLARFEVVYLH